ncbi:hypothetical protein GCM10009782_02680 [Glycomyces algeriensis]
MTRFSDCSAVSAIFALTDPSLTAAPPTAVGAAIRAGLGNLQMPLDDSYNDPGWGGGHALRPKFPENRTRTSNV